MSDQSVRPLRYPARQYLCHQPQPGFARRGAYHGPAALFSHRGGSLEPFEILGTGGGDRFGGIHYVSYRKTAPISKTLNPLNP